MTDFAPIRWGILGPGSIANRFAEGVKALPDHQLAAVGSRDQTRANAFADKWEIPRRHAGYQELVEDPDVDIIYVATPHPFHKENSLQALRAGKAVLCEKPFTINAREAEEVIRTARERKLFLMEGMWTRYFPVMVKVRELLKEGAIGEVRMVQADFGFHSNVNPASRLYDPALGGRALLDVGIYPISFASMVLGEPERVTGLATIGTTGVDENDGMVFQYRSGAIAVLATSVRANTPQEATILGTAGRIRIHTPWWSPKRLTVHRNGQEPQEMDLPYESSGFNYEAAEAGRCLRAGKLESDVMPLDESLALMRTMDTLRAQWGVKYPVES